MDTNERLQKIGVPKPREIPQYHSACCRGNWELVYGDSKFELQCSLCGRSIGPAFKIIGPDLEKAKCQNCGHSTPETPLEQWLREKAPRGSFAPIDREKEAEFTARMQAATSDKEKKKITEEVNTYMNSIIQRDVKMVEGEKTIHEGELLLCTRTEDIVDLHFPNCTIFFPRENFEEVQNDFRAIANTYEAPRGGVSDNKPTESKKEKSEIKDIYQGEIVSCWGDEEFVTLSFPYSTIDFDREDWNQIKTELLAIGNIYEPSFIYKDSGQDGRPKEGGQ